MALRLSVSRIGVTGVEKVTRIGPPGDERLLRAHVDCFVEPGTAPRDERVEDAIRGVVGALVVGAPGGKAERLAERIAVEVRERLRAHRAEVRVAARYPQHLPAPVSGIATQEIYTLLGTAMATERGARRIVGVAAQGMAAAPRTHDELEGRLAASGFGADRIRRIRAAVPMPTHDQRGYGTLQLGLLDAREIDARDLLTIVEASMSSEIYELMKRTDERAVVERATRRPRTAEDCVRAAIAGTIERFGDLPDEAFLSARQEHLETLRGHRLVAERHGLLGELRRDAATRTTMRDWLSAAGSDPRRAP